MRTAPRRSIVAATMILACSVAASATDDWTSFRGKGANGIADGKALATSWNVETGHNVRFAVPLPGKAYSSPIVAGSRIFLTTAVPRTGAGEKEFEWFVLSLNRDDGRILWQNKVAEGVPRTGRHPTASQTNPTPASDGQTVVAILGSEGLFALSGETGEELWQVDLGVLHLGLLGDTESMWGYASSPIIHDGLVIVQVDLHANSYLAAYSLDDGNQVWRVERDERPAWATPTVHVGDRTELIVQGGHYIRGYRPSDGHELWRFSDESEVKQPTPFVSNGAIVLAGGYKGRPLMSLKLGATGDVSSPAPRNSSQFLRWRSEDGGPYTSTPIAYRGHIFFVRNTGVLTVLDESTGEIVHRERLGESFYASPVANNGHLYFPGQDGSMYVVTATATPEIVAEIDMGEPLNATPAVADGILYIRGSSKLWAIEAAASGGGSSH